MSDRGWARGSSTVPIGGKPLGGLAGGCPVAAGSGESARIRLLPISRRTSSFTLAGPTPLRRDGRRMCPSSS
jgi:hypothetical protein